jgi:hypothetical protein
LGDDIVKAKSVGPIPGRGLSVLKTDDLRNLPVKLSWWQRHVLDQTLRHGMLWEPVPPLTIFLVLVIGPVLLLITIGAVYLAFAYFGEEDGTKALFLVPFTIFYVIVWIQMASLRSVIRRLYHHIQRSEKNWEDRDSKQEP